MHPRRTKPEASGASSTDNTAGAVSVAVTPGSGTAARKDAPNLTVAVTFARLALLRSSHVSPLAVVHVRHSRFVASVVADGPGSERMIASRRLTDAITAFTSPIALS